MKATAVKTPHDKFFKETLTRRENAISFFREYLPEKIVSQFDWRTLRISKDTFIEPELEERFSDIVYEILAKGKPVFIYLLLEHQSYVDKWIPLRLLGYMIKIWDLYLKQNSKAEKLPVIIPVLFYHGQEKWNVSVHFQDLLYEPELCLEFIPKFQYILRDFSAFSDEEIRGIIMLRVFLTVMSKIFSPNFTEEFDRMLSVLAELSKKQTGMEYIKTVIRYIYHVSDESFMEIETKLIQAINDEKRREEIMTIAERLRMEGELRGEIKGEIKGQIKGEIKGKIETYREFLASGLLSTDLRRQLEQKIAELNRQLEKVAQPVQ